MRKPLTYEQAMAVKELVPVGGDRRGGNLWTPGPAVTAKYKGQEMVDTNFPGPTPDDFQTINAESRTAGFIPALTTCIGRTWR